MKKQIISITEKALLKIKELIHTRGQSTFGIRIGIRQGGCSGFKYILEYAQELKPYEEEIISEDIRILIDPKAIMHIIGSEMDYAEEQFKSGFVFNNPNAKNMCGCGKSFGT